MIGADTELARVASTNGGEYAGPCPFCGGVDRFRVQPRAAHGGRWWCRQCSPDQRWRDAIAYVRQRDGLELPAACAALGIALPTWERIRPPLHTIRTIRTIQPPDATAIAAATLLPLPSPAWRFAAALVAARCQAILWSPAGVRAEVLTMDGTRRPTGPRRTRPRRKLLALSGVGALLGMARATEPAEAEPPAEPPPGTAPSPRRR